MNSKSIRKSENKLGSKKKSFISMVIQYKGLLLMLAPSIIFIIVFAYLPMGGIIVAFKNYNYGGGIFFSPWNGLENFKFFFMSGMAWPVTRNTFLYNLAFIIVGMTLEVTFAIIISEFRNVKFKRIIQSSLFLPFFISWVVVSSIFYNVFNYNTGVFNTVLTSLGLEKFNVYGTASIWPFLLVFLKAWKNVGYGTVIYLANIASINPALYEAAEIDGANIWQRVRFITVPSITPTMIILLLLAMGRIFRGDFGMFYQLVGNNGSLFPVADIIDTFVFRALISSADIGMSAASGLYQSIMCLITILVANKIVKMVQPEYTLF